MTKVILHIGYGKTGTTAIQRFLNRNRAALTNVRTLYPDFYIHGAWLNVHNHNFLGRALAGRVGWWGRSAEQLIDQVKEQAHLANSKTIILSAEAFLGGVQPWDFSEPADYRNACQTSVGRLARNLEEYELKIVVYLRRQDQWLESVLNQNIKYAALMPPVMARASIEDTCRIYTPRLDYAAVLEPWRCAFGDEAISVGVYERTQLRDGDIVSDFKMRAGLTTADLKMPTWNGVAENRALNRDVIELKKILNRIDRPKYEERIMVESLYRISDALPANHREISTHLLPAALRRAILDRAAISNMKVAELYLGRPDGVLFREPPLDSSEPNSDYTGLETHVAIEILLRLDRDLNSVRGRARLFRHWLAERLRKKFPILHGIGRRFRSVIPRFHHD